MSSEAALREENARLKTLLGTKDTRIRQLEALLHALRHRHFGASSERSSAEQLKLFTETEDAEVPEAQAAPVPVKGHTRRRNGRPRLPDDLPRVEVVHDLDDADKVCAEHGCALERIGEETSEQLNYIPATVEVIRHVCLKYACPTCEGHLVTATKPPQPIEKSVATAGLLAWIIVSKYVDALPLYRQSAIFARLGIAIDRTTMANWMIACGTLVQPLINLLRERLYEQAVLHMDETTVQVLSEPGKTAQSKSYMWVSAAGPPRERIVLFDYSPSRSGATAIELVGDYRGALMVDGYEGYEPVCVANGIVRLGCWAHARRGFVDAQRQQVKGKTGKADKALSMINALYRIERTLKDENAEVRYAQRQRQAVPILEKLRKWLDKSLTTTAPKTALGKALTYLDNQWPRLEHYVDDGRYPIDNNRAENAIRPFVIGRKNWIFSKSVRGVKASANLYGLIETAKANGIDPWKYLDHVLAELPKAQTIDDIALLLPGNFANGD